jgi:hypothetical protein
MSERTDERTVGDRADADLDPDDREGDGDAGPAGDVGFDDGELGVDVDALTGDPASADSSSETTDASADSGERTGSGPGLLSRLRPSVSVSSPLSAVPTPRSLAVSLGVVVVSMLVGGALLPLGDVGSIIGIFIGAFLIGVVSSKQRYLELVASGAVAAAVSVVLGRLLLSAVAGLAVPLAAVGAGGGAAAALLGHYFGRDLRDGVTRDVDG